jgi:hypothetical protein
MMDAPKFKIVYSEEATESGMRRECHIEKPTKHDQETSNTTI